MNQITAEKPVVTEEYLSFRVAGDSFCVGIMSVREIRSWTKATPLPHAPDYLRGVINLRGTVLPVVDLAIRLNMTSAKDNPRRVVIVVETGGILSGLLVDAVSDILELSTDQFQASPDIRSHGTDDFLTSLAVVDDQMIRVLNLEKVAQNDEATTI